MLVKEKTLPRCLLATHKLQRGLRGKPDPQTDAEGGGGQGVCSLEDLDLLPRSTTYGHVGAGKSLDPSEPQLTL